MLGHHLSARFDPHPYVSLERTMATAADLLTLNARWWNVNEHGEAYDSHPTQAQALLVQAEYPNDAVVQASSAQEAERLAFPPAALEARAEYLAMAEEAVRLNSRLQAVVASLDAYEAAHPDEPRHDA